MDRQSARGPSRSSPLPAHLGEAEAELASRSLAGVEGVTDKDVAQLAEAFRLATRGHRAVLASRAARTAADPPHDAGR